MPCFLKHACQILADLNSPTSSYVDAEGFVRYDQAYFVNVLMSAKEAKAILGRRTCIKVQLYNESPVWVALRGVGWD